MSFNKYKKSDSEKIFVYLIAGQSNALGCGMETDNLIAYSDSRFINGFNNVLYYGAQERLDGGPLNVNFQPLKLGMGVSSTKSGPEIGIASAVADNGAMNAIIKCAWGSTHLYPDTLNRYKAEFLGRMELDIYIPSLKWGIEYDGKAWHKEDKRISEQKKYKLCKEEGIKLIRIREQITSIGSDIADDEFGIVKFNNKESLEETIKDIIKKINFTYKKISINLDRDEAEIRSLYQGKIKNSLQDLYPNVAKEWHPTKNGLLKPDNFNAGSEYKAWWLCTTCGYEWET